jgi:hypothetical protein
VGFLFRSFFFRVFFLEFVSYFLGWGLPRCRDGR